MSENIGAAGADLRRQIAELASQLAESRAELDEASAQQRASAEIMRVINSSPGNLAPVFEAMVEKATGLCDASFGVLWVHGSDGFRAAALRGVPPQLEERVRALINPHPQSGLARILAGESLVVNFDLGLAEEMPDRALAELQSGCWSIEVALRRDRQLLGALTVYRREGRPFPDRHIGLLQTFAEQAVIAMENARLLTETREALERQTATAEVLGLINASPGDLVPVYDSMLEKATRLAQAAFGVLWRFDGECFHAAAVRGGPPAFAEGLREPIRAQPGAALDLIVRGEPLAHIPDVAAEDAYRTGNASGRALVELGGGRTLLAVPLRKDDDTLLGAFAIFRQEVRPFADKQIALLQNFAAQAVIAMENARLLGETREALERQTATAEVLQVINSSPGDLAPVFEVMLEKATRLCAADAGVFASYDGEYFLPAAWRGFEDFPRDPMRPHPDTGIGRLARGEDIVHILDSASGAAYESGDPGRRAIVQLGGARSQLAAALRKESTLLGSFTLWRREVRPFTDKQIALLQNFAAQAVIAMENARLLDELRQRTAEVAELNRGLEARVAAQVEELGRVGRLKRFLAPQLAEMIVSQRDEKILESHRREIVVVFCDLRGYTAFTETAEPEEVLDFLREYHGALGPLVSRFEGTLDQFSGDGIMVFFNDPVPIPDAAERAVGMAIAMREAAGSLIAGWRARGRDLGFGAGIAQGYATLGQIGFSERSGYTAIGTVCNVAARLCGEAKDGQILLSQRVNAALKGSVATEQLGALALKGLTQPVVAFNVPPAPGPAALRVIEGGSPKV